MRIYKYQPTAEDGPIRLPVAARILHIGTQEGVPTIWAATELDEKKEVTEIRADVLPTGAVIGPDDLDNHVLTAGDMSVPGLVWHVFMEPRPTWRPA